MDKFIDYIAESNSTSQVKSQINSDKELIIGKIDTILGKYAQDMLDDPKFEGASEDFIVSELKKMIKGSL